MEKVADNICGDTAITKYSKLVNGHWEILAHYFLSQPFYVEDINIIFHCEKKYLISGIYSVHSDSTTLTDGEVCIVYYHRGFNSGVGSGNWGTDISTNGMLNIDVGRHGKIYASFSNVNVSGLGYYSLDVGPLHSAPEHYNISGNITVK